MSSLRDMRSELLEVVRSAFGDDAQARVTPYSRPPHTGTTAAWIELPTIGGGVDSPQVSWPIRLVADGLTEAAEAQLDEMTAAVWQAVRAAGNRWQPVGSRPEVWRVDGPDVASPQRWYHSIVLTALKRVAAITFCPPPAPWPAQIPAERLT